MSIDKEPSIATWTGTATAEKQVQRSASLNARTETKTKGNFPEDTLIFERKTPLEAEEFMHKFDEEKTALPFEFELDLEGVQI